MGLVVVCGNAVDSVFDVHILAPQRGRVYQKTSSDFVVHSTGTGSVGSVLPLSGVEWARVARHNVISERNALDRRAIASDQFCCDVYFCHSNLVVFL